MVRENLDFFESLPGISQGHVVTILFDSGYNKDYIERKIQEICPEILSKIVIEVVPKISDDEKKAQGLAGFVVTPKRWVVERSYSWLEKCRLLWKNCESKLATSVAEIKICFIRLILRRLI